MTEMLQIIPLDEVEAPPAANPAYLYENHQTPNGPLPITADDRTRILQALPAGIAAGIAGRIEAQSQPDYQPEAKYEDGPYEEGIALKYVPTKTRQYIGGVAVNVFAALLEKRQIQATEN